jgi:polysaccharide chain length determinant protein (PEP-CTERM system associated)
MPIKEVLAQLLSAVRSAWRFRWTGAAAAWALCLVGWAWVIWQPNVYEAKARVYVDTSSVLGPILNNRIISPNVTAELSYVRQALLGSEQLERVIGENALDSSVTTEGGRERLLNALRTDIQITSRDGERAVSNTYNISYRHSDRDKAVGVVKTLLNSLVETTLGAGREGTDTAERFLDERIVEYENRLQQAEFARADFKKRNAERLPGSEGGYFERIRQETAALEESGKALRLARTKHDRLAAQLNSESPLIPSGLEQLTEPLPNSLDARIRDYRVQLDTLLLEYTDRHPDVIAVRETLQRLERQRTEQLAELGVGGSDAEFSQLNSNPIYQASRIALNQIDVEVGGLEADVRERTQKLAALQALIDEVPQVEAELARLNRDYDVIYENYQSLVRSRETQELSRKAAITDEVDFRVIDPPMADLQPVAPKRLFLLFAVLMMGVGGGGAVCWLLSQLQPVFSSAARLRAVCGLPVLGVVTQGWQGQHSVRRRISLLAFAGALGGLAVLFAAGVFIELLGPGVHSFVGAS